VELPFRAKRGIGVFETPKIFHSGSGVQTASVGQKLTATKRVAASRTTLIIG
jgi:hypothetical protein